MVESGCIERANTFSGDQVTIGDHPGNHLSLTNSTDDLLQLRVQERLTTANRNDGGPKIGQLIDSGYKLPDWDRIGVIVILITVPTGKITPACRDQMGQQRMILRNEPTNNHAPLTGSQSESTPCSHRVILPYFSTTS